MSADDDVFIVGGQSASEVRRVIEAALGGRFALSTDPDPVPALAVGPTQVFFYDGHPFEDDTGLPLTRYQYQVKVRDSERDQQRQLTVARQAFEAASAAGWQAVLVRDLQEVIAHHP